MSKLRISKKKIQAVIDDESIFKIINNLVQSALNGDKKDARFIVDVYGRRKGRPINLNIDWIENNQDIEKAATIILNLTTQGEISCEEGKLFLEILHKKYLIDMDLNLKERFEKVEVLLGLKPSFDNSFSDKTLTNIKNAIIDDKIEKSSVDNPKKYYIKKFVTDAQLEAKNENTNEDEDEDN